MVNAQSFVLMPVAVHTCLSKKRIALMEIVRKVKFATVVQSAMLTISRMHQQYHHP